MLVNTLIPLSDLMWYPRPVAISSILRQVICCQQHTFNTQTRLSVANNIQSLVIVTILLARERTLLGWPIVRVII